MDKKMLQKSFRQFKKNTSLAAHKVDYAITSPDSLGDCQSCVNAALCDKYGEESKGVWVKHWTRGMNGDFPLDYKYNDGSDAVNYVYVGHDLDAVQVALFYQTLGENYNILPKQEDFDAGRCFCLYEKQTSVWSVSYIDASRENRKFSSDFTDKDKALQYVGALADVSHYEDVCINKVF